jgi:hypothetical protein
MTKNILLILVVIFVMYYGSKLLFTEDKTVLGYDTGKIIDYGKLFKHTRKVLPPL